MNKRLLALSWCMPPMITPRAINVSRTLAAIARHGWSVTAVCGDLPATERVPYTWDQGLYEKYRPHFTTRSVPYEPDGGYPSWEDGAFRAVRDYIRAAPPHALVTFAQPFSDHIIGLKVKHAFPSLPWLAHFSDPWVDNPYAAADERERFLEREAIKNADGLIFVTDRTRNLVMAKYPAAWLEKCHVVPHGYDARPGLPQPATKAPLHLVHTGGIYGKRIPYALLEALKAVRDSGQLCRVSFVGPVDEEFRRQAGMLHDYVSFSAPTTPDKAEAMAREADVLLLCDAPANESVFLPSKLIDYLPLGLPILALTPARGSSADVLRDVGGLSIDPEDATAIAEVLRRLIAMKAAEELCSLTPRAGAVKRYAIEETTKLFAAALNALPAGSNGQNYPERPFCTSYHCPEHGSPLAWKEEDEGRFLCPHGCVFPVHRGLARFVPDDHYASSSSLQWNTFRRTQLDSYTGTSISRDRLSRILGGLDWLEGKEVLEAGCGSGRFSEVLLQAGARLHSLNFSSAVDAARRNCACFPEHRVCQANILRMPFAKGYFDAVICIGVVQHTPNPEESIAALAAMLKPGGALFIDHYAPGYPMFPGRRLLRFLLLRLPLSSRLPVCRALRKALWPAHVALHARQYQRVFRRLYRWLITLSPLVDYQNAYPQLSADILREWALLDMHDLATNVYKHLRTTDEIRSTLEELGLIVERCEYAGNGVEASARKPLRGNAP